MKYANASVAVICIAAAGFFTAIIEPLIFKSTFNWTDLGLGLLALTGIYIIFDFHPKFKLGIFFGIISAIGSAAFPLFNKKLLREFAPKVLTFYEFLGALIGLTCCLPFYFLSWIKPDLQLICAKNGLLVTDL